MLEQESLDATLVGSLIVGDGVFQSGEDLAGRAYHRDDNLSELALLKHEIGEMRRELRESRSKLDESLRIARRRDRARAAARSLRQRRTRGSAVARGILRVMVAVFTLGGTIAGVGIAVTVIHVWGDNAAALIAAAVAGLGVALAAWLLAALAAILLETADAVRNLPA